MSEIRKGGEMTFEKTNIDLEEGVVEPMYQCKCADSDTSKTIFSSSHRCGNSGVS